MPLNPVFSRHTGKVPHFMDEPLNGLDKGGVKEIREVIMGLKYSGKTILLTSHNSEDIQKLADEIWEMDAGRMTRMDQQAPHE